MTRGFGDYVVGLVNGMAAYADIALVLSRKDEWITSFIDPRVKIMKSGAPRVSHPGNLVSMAQIRRFICDFKPDLVHLQSRMVWETPVVRSIPGLRYVITAHDVVRHPRRKRFIPQFILDCGIRGAPGVIVHGESLMHLARQRFGCRKIANLPHGLIYRYGSGEAHVKPKENRVLLFGTLDEWKGIEHFVRCEPVVREQVPDVRFVIAGRSSDPNYHRSLPCPGQHVEMRLGFQDDEQVRSLFSSADVLVLPYTDASQSGVLQVGFSFGIPPVVTGVGALTDIVRHEENGLVVNSGDTGALAFAIVRLLTDFSLRSRVISEMKKDRETSLHWGNIACKTIEFYESILSN